MYFAQLLLQKCRTTHQAGGRASGCLLRFSSLIHGEPGNEREGERKRGREGETRKPARTSEGKRREGKRGNVEAACFPPSLPQSSLCLMQQTEALGGKHHFGIRAVVGLHITEAFT